MKRLMAFLVVNRMRISAIIELFVVVERLETTQVSLAEKLVATCYGMR